MSRYIQSEIKIQRQQFPTNYKSCYPILGISTAQKADTNV